MRCLQGCVSVTQAATTAGLASLVTLMSTVEVCFASFALLPSFVVSATTSTTTLAARHDVCLGHSCAQAEVALQYAAVQ